MRSDLIRLDTYKLYSRTIPLVQYNTTELQFELKNRGEIIDIAMHDIILNAKRPDGYIITQNADIIKDDDILKIKLNPKILKLAGDVSFEIVLIKDGSVISTYPFFGYVTATVTDIEDVLDNIDKEAGTIAAWEYL